MADAHHHRETIFEADAGHPVPPAATSLTTFAVLLGLAVVQLGVGFSGDALGPWKVAASLAVAVAQAGVLAVYMMDLRHADKLTWLCAGAAVFWTFLMFLFILTDYLTRHFAAY